MILSETTRVALGFIHNEEEDLTRMFGNSGHWMLVVVSATSPASVAEEVLADREKWWRQEKEIPDHAVMHAFVVVRCDKHWKQCERRRREEILERVICIVSGF